MQRTKRNYQIAYISQAQQTTSDLMDTSFTEACIVIAHIQLTL